MEIWLQAFLTSSLHEGNIQFHAPTALAPWKDTPAKTEGQGGLTVNKDALASRLPLMGPIASKDALSSTLKEFQRPAWTWY